MSRILVDSKAGSNDITYGQHTRRPGTHPGLARYIVPQSRVSVVRNLPCDVYFTGLGPEGSVLDVGIEYKTIWDVLDCINTGRFSGNQLPALREMDYAFLLIEGLVRESGDERGNRLEVYGTPLGCKQAGWYDSAEWGRGQRIWTYVELEHWLWSMWLRGGVYPLQFTRSKWDSGRRVGSLWQAFNDKAWEEHTSHLAHSKAHLAPLRGDAPPFLRAIMEYSSVGHQLALAAESTFGGSMNKAATAPVETWAGIQVGGGVGKGGRRKKAHKLGRKRAQKIYDELRGK